MASRTHWGRSSVVILSWVVSGLAMVACGDAATAPQVPARDASLAIQTAALEVPLRVEGDTYRGALVFTFVNRSARTVVIEHCNGLSDIVLEKQVGRAWVRAWSPVRPLCRSIPPIEVRAGASRTDTLAIHAGRAGTNVIPQFDIGSVDGVYRVQWPALRYLDRPDELLPASERESNAFSLTVR